MYSPKLWLSVNGQLSISDVTKCTNNYFIVNVTVSNFTADFSAVCMYLGSQDMIHLISITHLQFNNSEKFTGKPAQ